MMIHLEKLIDVLSRPKIYLIGGNFLLAIFLIWLSNGGILPMAKTQDFLFFAALGLIFALYRPGWAFLFFIGTLAFENINLAPEPFGIAVRPYQFVGGIALLAVAIRFSFRQIGFDLPKWKLIDGAVAMLALAGFLSVSGALDRGVSLKQSAIALTFAGLYFLARIFIQNLEDLKRTAPFFLSSGIVVVFYGIWQNIRFAKGLESFEVMPGRPNATFTEPDWLGIYLVLLIACAYAIIFYLNKAVDDQERPIFNFQFSISKFLKLFSLYSILSASYILLILIVSRSAWLGAAGVTMVFLLAIFTRLKLDPQEWQWKETLKIKIGILISLALGIGSVYFFHLTTFQLLNRAASTTSGLQKITISCEADVSLPDKIDSVDDLQSYDCRHINLEEITSERSANHFVKEINRPDPNVNIRAQIYQKSWATIKENPILGIGWGNISQILGTDESGTPLNSSNLFLETYLGSGIVGFLALMYIFVHIFVRSLANFRSENSERKIIGLLILLGIVALLIPNLFNAGVFLGILWVFLGIAISLI